MAELSSAELKKKKKEAEERAAAALAEVRGFDDKLASRCEWTGPTVFVKIHADTATVVTSTAVIGKPEFGESLFRKRLEELAEGRAADEGTMAERKIAEAPMVEMRFDRYGETLQLIVNAMRGYPMRAKLRELKLSQVEMFLADCEFYKLPSLLTKFGPAPDTKLGWDLCRIEAASHTVIESSRRLVRKGSDGWKCSGLTDVLRSGDNKWVEFNIQKTASKNLMFGVVEFDSFSTNGYFGTPLKGVGYYAWNGHLYYPSTRKSFAEVSGAGDNIRIAVRIAVSGKSARMTVSKNGSEIGTEELTQYISVEDRLVFAVCTYNAEDEFIIVGNGM